MGKSTVKLTLRYERLDGRGRPMKLGRRDAASLEFAGVALSGIGRALKAGRSAPDIQQAINDALEGVAAAEALMARARPAVPRRKRAHGQ